MGIPNKKEDPNSQHGGDMGQYRKLEVDSSMTFELANGIGNDANIECLYKPDLLAYFSNCEGLLYVGYLTVYRTSGVND